MKKIFPLLLILVLPIICFSELSKKELAHAQTLYDTYCVSCHGENLDGNGEVAELLEPYPRNFTKYQFVIAYKDRFKNSLLNGVAGSAMPPWKNVMSTNQIDLLVDFIEMKILEKSPVQAFERIEYPIPEIGTPDDRLFVNKNDPDILLLKEGDPQEGWAGFNKYCVGCHGRLANGKGPNAKALGHAIPRNLINKHFLNQDYITDERLYQSILLGVAGAPMPAHDHLSDQTIIDIIAFIRSNIESDK
ncbi:MAG: c-type cytochrome [Verrucomicrobiota bacterium]|nr:c-type cytochrome [Verrucomicrobiota bacterium]MEC7908219.1 c-type cytochrome [Verrucomicrobiota bacterium]